MYRNRHPSSSSYVHQDSMASNINKDDDDEEENSAPSSFYFHQDSMASNINKDDDNEEENSAPSSFYFHQDSMASNINKDDDEEEKNSAPSSFYFHQDSMASNIDSELLGNSNLPPPCSFPSSSSFVQSQQTMHPPSQNLLDDMTESLRSCNLRDSSPRHPMPFSVQSPLCTSSTYEQNLYCGMSQCCMLKNLMTKPQGIDVFIDYLGNSSYEQIRDLVCCLVQDKKMLVQLAKDSCGCVCVMRLVVKIKASNTLLHILTSALREGVHELMIDQHAIFLVRLCLASLSYADNEFIFDAAASHCLRLAKNGNGRYCLQECLLRSKDRKREKILRKITKKSLLIAVDSKGNHVIQTALRLSNEKFNLDICQSFCNHIEDLSFDQYGSYVLEECFKSSGRDFLLYQLVSFDESILRKIASDRYGNYVLQAAISFSQGTEYHDQLVCYIRSSLANKLKNTTFGNKVLRRIDEVAAGRPS